MAKKHTTPAQRPEIRIRGVFTKRTYIVAYRAATGETGTAGAESELQKMIASGKIALGPLVGLYPGIQSYYFARR
jgi:hypothetical protein